MPQVPQALSAASISGVAELERRRCHAFLLDFALVERHLLHPMSAGLSNHHLLATKEQKQGTVDSLCTSSFMCLWGNLPSAVFFCLTPSSGR